MEEAWGDQTPLCYAANYRKTTTVPDRSLSICVLTTRDSQGHCFALSQ
jgi:hypothetical protein